MSRHVLLVDQSVPVDVLQVNQCNAVLVYCIAYKSVYFRILVLAPRELEMAANVPVTYDVFVENIPLSARNIKVCYSLVPCK